MINTKVVLLTSKTELDEFLLKNDVLSVQAIIVFGALYWNVWYQ